jgi:hypothetical protein
MSLLRRFSFQALAAAAALLLAAACNRSTPPSAPAITLVQDAAGASVAVTGIGARAAKALARLPAVSDEWERVFTLRVLGPDGAASPTPVAGKHVVDGDTLRFTPLFPLDGGRRYQARYAGAGDRSGESPQLLETVVSPPAPAPQPPVHVTGVFPTSDLVPENQLRMYIHFSGPMGRRPALEHVRLLDDKGRQVVDPFLPVDGELWNADRTRYTLFFDPGRQKRGILPNREMGPSLEAGRKYTLVVDREWIDGNGNPLREVFTRPFRVGPPALAPLDPATWKIAAPPGGTRMPIEVTFPQPLDHGLLLRAIGVRRDGRDVLGEIQVDAHETRWVMTPASPWTPGRYEVVALGILEDLAGNRIARAFEVDEAERPASEDDAKVTTVPFTLAVAPR